ncbi:MAG: tetratricopeptide repeat protein, partial [Anaerolineae bacterium]
MWPSSAASSPWPATTIPTPRSWSAGWRRTLLVLDNVETLVEAVEANDAAARDLADFLRSGLAGSGAGLLVTSRRHLGWPGEESLELGGLEPAVGGRLFAQSAPQRQPEVDLPLAEGLSRRVEGHPLSLRLLGAAFNAGQIPLAAFAAATEKHLLTAADRYKGADHRQSTLYACLETSVRMLNVDLTGLLSDLRIFHAPFLPETAAAILAPDDQESAQQTILDRLYTLWQRGLLERRVYAVREGDVLFYHLLPVARAYLEAYLPAATAADLLQARFGAAMASLARRLYDTLDSDEGATIIAQQAGDDLRRGAAWVEGEAQGYFWLHLGWISQRLGDRQTGLTLTMQALDRARGYYPRLEPEALNNLAGVYDDIGQPQRALALYAEALPIRRAVGDRAGEATTLNNMALVYSAIGQPQRALALVEEALSIMRAVGDRAGEAATLNNLAGVYRAIGQPQRALALVEEALSIMRAVGNRAGEAATLNNMAALYGAIGQPQRALALYEEALPIMRAVGDRAGKATTLNNMAVVYDAIGQPE